MANVEYTAVDRGELVSGHTATTVYNFDFDLSALAPRRNNIKTTRKAIDGTTKTILYRQEEYLDITTTLVLRGSSAYNSWIEFFQSVIAGETFQIDAYGTNAVPVDPVNVLMEGDYNEIRESQLNYFRFSFTVREI